MSELGTLDGPVKKSDSLGTELNIQPSTTATVPQSSSSQTDLVNQFTNKSFKYRIKYPKDWRLTENPDQQTPVSIENYAILFAPRDNNGTVYQSRIIISCSNVENTNKSLEEAFNQIFRGYSDAGPSTVKVLNKTHITFCNHPALKVTLSEIMDNPVKVTVQEEMILMPVPGKTYMITTYTESGKESQYSSLFQKILDSFDLF